MSAFPDHAVCKEYISLEMMHAEKICTFCAVSNTVCFHTRHKAWKSAVAKPSLRLSSAVAFPEASFNVTHMLQRNPIPVLQSVVGIH